MKYKIKNLYIIAFLLISLFVPEKSYSQQTQKTLYEDVCEIRRMFCGGATLAIAATAVIIIGFLLFTGKFQMSAILVAAFGLMIFVSAELLIEAFLNPPAGVGVMQSCSCN